MNRKATLARTAAGMLLATLVAGCASDTQLTKIAETEGITIEEARKRQIAAANDVEEVLPGSISGFIGGGGD